MKVIASLLAYIVGAFLAYGIGRLVYRICRGRLQFLIYWMELMLLGQR